MTEDGIIPFPGIRRSPTVTSDMAAKMKALLKTGMNQHDIAAHFRVNQGRVSEVNTGMIYPGIEPTQLEFPFN